MLLPHHRFFFSLYTRSRHTLMEKERMKEQKNKIELYSDWNKHLPFLFAVRTNDHSSPASFASFYLYNSRVV